MKKLLLSVCLTLMSMSLFAQQETFVLRSDGTFVNRVNNKSYILLKCSGISQEDLYYNFLITLQNKCVVSEGQYAVVPNKSINIFRYESKYNVSSGFWGATFNGYLYYKLMFQFRDGQVRIEAPIVDHLGNPYTKTESYWQFQDVLKFVGLFEKDGSVKEKRREQVEKLESDINGVIADIIKCAYDNMKW